MLAWWLLWVSINILRVTFRSSVEPGAGGALSSSSNILILETLRILAAVGAIYFVHTVSSWQDKRYELLSELAEQQPAAETADESNPYENFS